MRISHKAKLAMSIMAMVGGLAFVGSAQAEEVECKFVSTVDNNPLPIKVHDDDTPEAKEFYKTCKNPYTKKFAADPEAAKAGKKKFGYYSCTQCHGGNAGGQTGPSIIDDRWQYPKHVTDKGMLPTRACLNRFLVGLRQGCRPGIRMYPAILSCCQPMIF